MNLIQLLNNLQQHPTSTLQTNGFSLPTQNTTTNMTNLPIPINQSVPNTSSLPFQSVQAMPLPPSLPINHYQLPHHIQSIQNVPNQQHRGGGGGVSGGNALNPLPSMATGPNTSVPSNHTANSRQSAPQNQMQSLILIPVQHLNQQQSRGNQLKLVDSAGNPVNSINGVKSVNGLQFGDGVNGLPSNVQLSSIHSNTTNSKSDGTLNRIAPLNVNVHSVNSAKLGSLHNVTTIKTMPGKTNQAVHGVAAANAMPPLLELNGMNGVTAATVSNAPSLNLQHMANMQSTLQSIMQNISKKNGPSNRESGTATTAVGHCGPSSNVSGKMTKMINPFASSPSSLDFNALASINMRISQMNGQGLTASSSSSSSSGTSPSVASVHSTQSISVATRQCMDKLAEHHTDTNHKALIRSASSTPSTSTPRSPPALDTEERHILKTEGGDQHLDVSMSSISAPPPIPPRITHSTSTSTSTSTVTLTNPLPTKMETDSSINAMNTKMPPLDDVGSKELKSCYCPECGKHFKSQYHLVGHQKSVHPDGSKPTFPSCPYCGKEFTHHGNRRTHIRTHTNERPFKCKQCDKAFKQKHRFQIPSSSLSLSTLCALQTDCKWMASLSMKISDCQSAGEQSVRDTYCSSTERVVVSRHVVDVSKIQSVLGVLWHSVQLNKFTISISSVCSR